MHFIWKERKMASLKIPFAFAGLIWIDLNGSYIYECKFCKFQSKSPKIIELHIVKEHRNDLWPKQMDSSENSDQKVLMSLARSQIHTQASKSVTSSTRTSSVNSRKSVHFDSRRRSKSIKPYDFKQRNTSTTKIPASASPIHSLPKSPITSNSAKFSHRQPELSDKIPVHSAVECHKCHQKFENANSLELHSQRYHILICIYCQTEQPKPFKSKQGF